MFYHGWPNVQKEVFKTMERGWGASGTVAEWSKALLKREEINENQKIPGSPPGRGSVKKVFIKGFQTFFPASKILMKL